MRLQLDDADELQNVEQELEARGWRGNIPSGECGLESTLAFNSAILII